MKDYGSVDYHENHKCKSYSALEKRTIVTAIEQGRLTIGEAKIAYNIKSDASCDYLTPEQAHLRSGKLRKRWKNYNRSFSHENTAV